MLGWIIVALNAIQSLGLAFAIIVLLKKIRWLEEVQVPWMVRISGLLHDDTNPITPPPPVKG